MSKIEKLPKSYMLPKLPTEAEYEAARKKFISEYKTYHSGIFSGGERYDPVLGAARWDAVYPEGYGRWAGEAVDTFNGYGQRKIAEKVNEIIKYLNKSENAAKQQLPRKETNV